MILSTETLEVLEAPFEWPERNGNFQCLFTFILSRHKAWIAGSYPLSLFNTFEPGDIDIFVQNGSGGEVVELLKEYGYKRDLTAYQGAYPPLVEKHPVYLFEHSEWPLVNLVVGAYECLEDVWATFDLSICEIGIAYDKETNCLVLACSPKHVETMTTGVVQVNEENMGSTISRRIWKYTDRGWHKYLFGGSGGTVCEIQRTTDGFVGTWPGHPDWLVSLDDLPPLTIE